MITYYVEWVMVVAIDMRNCGGDLMKLKDLNARSHLLQAINQFIMETFTR